MIPGNYSGNLPWCLTDTGWLLCQANRMSYLRKALGINVTKTGLQVPSLTIPKKLSPGGSEGTGLPQQVFCPIKQVSSAMWLVDI